MDTSSSMKLARMQDIQWILASLLISNYKARYILDAGRRSSSLENRTR
ncbi:hypothetical protein HanPSC8_Chr07g0287821 [Helianthus annuus]|nr:hypothetical protein HanPSC8_Chr07g0287821 [Helianthus annuus]